jgi:ADP-ribose pyrophosphatase
MHLPIVLNSEIVFHESFIKMERDLLQIESLPPYHYYTLRTYPASVAILATTPSGEFVLTHEYRHPTGQVLLACPGGYIDGDEHPIDAAKRELLEETGYEANSYNIIGSAFPFTGFSGQKTIYILAKDAHPATTQKLESSEVISPLLLTPQELTTQMKEGVATDGTLCTALYFYSLTKT